jgi:soluble lytic murein transglycosylase-like protein
MEKRHKKTLARTLSWPTSWLNAALIAALFVPAFLATQYRAPGVRDPETTQRVQIAEKPHPKELVEIYAIVKSSRPDIAEHEAWEISEAIQKESSRYNLDPILVLAVIDIESKFQYGAISPAGARGIMQIMPDVGKALVREVQLERDLSIAAFTPEHLDNPILNIKIGTYYLHDLKKSFRNLTATLIAYNLGPTELRNRMDNDVDYPDEFASAVLAIYQKFKTAKLPTF